MCRYAFPYKPHYACFACRKSFKRRLLSDIKRGGVHRAARCPQCGGPMADMGYDFRPPPMKDVRQWRVLRGLYALGMTFHCCGCSGPGYRPRDEAAARSTSCGAESPIAEGATPIRVGEARRCLAASDRPHRRSRQAPSP